jgi:alpha-tubulin suppressor-like RCC1 family protein
MRSPASCRGSCAGRFGKELAPLLALSVLAATLGCRDDAGSPTEPAPTSSQANVSAATALAFWQVSGGGNHTCGVTTDNLAYCWGWNQFGQLGDGTNTGPERCTGAVGPFPCSTRPVLVAGGHSFRRMSAGYYHTCAVTTDSRAYCWGENGQGQLGDGTISQRLAPVAVAGGHQFRLVEAGSGFTCGVTTDNRAYCWGSNQHGQLGDGTLTARPRPVLVLGGLQFSQVSAGQDHSCGVTAANRAYCWGSNQYGQVGDSTEAVRRLKPSRVARSHQFRQVDAGAYHSCAVTTTERAFCWGSGREGQLGNGKTYLSFWPRAVAGGLYFQRVSAGLFHTCGETTDDRAYCWGANSFGQVGDGSQNTTRLKPVAVAGGLIFSQVSVGSWHSCGKTSAGVAYCWGYDFFAALGDGNSGYGAVGLTPVPVLGPM